MDAGVVLCEYVILGAAFFKCIHNDTHIPLLTQPEGLADDCNLGRASTLLPEAPSNSHSAIKSQRLVRSVERASIRCSHIGRRKNSDRHYKAQPAR